MNQDQFYMMRALALAKNGLGRTAPNPMVGCVIVKNQTIVGEGWHVGAGQPHAEIVALAAAGNKANGASVYVNLEPCNHHGRTSPCTDALLAAGINELVYAVADPNPLAAGGSRVLQQNGVLVRCGICQKQAKDINRFWLHGFCHERPFIIAKFAMSLDGKIATRTGDSQWITGPESRAKAHDLRREIDGIVVGSGTVIADNPSLTARNDKQTIAEPIRVILDSMAKTPISAKVYNGDKSKVILVTTKQAPQARLAQFVEHGVQVLTIAADHGGRPQIAVLLEALYARGVRSLMVEGGAQVLGSFFDAKLVDEVWAFVAPVLIGGAGPSPIAGAGVARLQDCPRLTEVKTQILGCDFLLRGTVKSKETVSCSQV